ncbi:pupal cuticle protein Edg-78E-like, partial [Neocloeon triangulifer]|uniref:pupal cuticle protein Edg-78E-like n=1 Tax=Neocloeon triangulifer TaxID=2078957 RepID=UPI00286F6EA4
KKAARSTCKVLVLLACAVCALAAPLDVPVVIPVVQRTEVRDLQGQFTLDYLSGDGTKVEEKGHLVPNSDGTDNVLVYEGTVSYVSPEGIPITLSYTADETGFHPVGDHLPRVAIPHV